MKKLFYVVCGVLLSLVPSAQAHYHCNVGAMQQVPGTPLYFVNGGAFVTNSGFVLTMNKDVYPGTTDNPATSASGTYSNYFVTTDVNGMTFTALDSDPGLNFNPICPGVQVCLRFIAVSGPPGGRFQVWDVANYFVGGDYNEDGNDADEIGFDLPVGTTNGTHFIQISENDGGAGDDPFGHIHGRQFSATKPGLYAVTVQAFDNSTNGPGGGPVQTPSDLLTIYFEADSEITTITNANDQVTLSFPAQLGTDYYLQASPGLGGTNTWQTISGPISGQDSFQIFTDSDWNDPRRFYRLSLTPTPE